MKRKHISQGKEGIAKRGQKLGKEDKASVSPAARQVQLRGVDKTMTQELKHSEGVKSSKHKKTKKKK